MDGKGGDGMKDDTISRKKALDTVRAMCDQCDTGDLRDYRDLMIEAFEVLPSAQQESKYEYHYDHTDCIWYRPEARDRCPSTCAQYRDGWNDAMQYIFQKGEGYRPYRRDKRYEG